MGKSGNELKARRVTDETIKRSITFAISCTTTQRLQVLTVRSHADANLSMLRLDFVVVASLSI
jgi:hypothetical protein